MKHAKRIFLFIAMIAIVMTSSIQVAFGQPTPTATVTVSPSPSPSPSSSPSSTATPDVSESVTSSAQATFTLLDINSVSEYVVRLQMRLRELGYFNYRATGMYYGMTQKAVKTFQEQNELSPDGQAGEITYNKLFALEALRKQLSTSALATIEAGPGPSLDTYTYGELSSWEEIDALFTVGTTVTVTDFNTGTTFQLTRTGGVNHADVEVPDTANYDIFVDSFEGENNWSEKRAVLVSIGGVQYAASLFGHPGGTDTVSDNGMEGHTDLYFNGSKSDTLGFTDIKHQERVLIAAGQIAPY